MAKVTEKVVKTRSRMITSRVEKRPSTDPAGFEIPEGGRVLYNSLGVSGLRRWGGYVNDEFLKELQGKRGVAVYSEMRYNDEVIGAVLLAFEYLAQQSKFRIDAGSEDQAAQETAEFIRQALFEDMEKSWPEMLSEILTVLPYGWCWMEQVFKHRRGEKSDTVKTSRFTDGKIGWAKWALRSQDSLFQWIWDENGGVLALVQQAPPDYRIRVIPLEKSLLFRTSTEKDNPEGRSLLRNAYRSYYFKKNLQVIEGIGAERDLAGYPMISLQEGAPDIWNPNDADAVTMRALLETIVKSIRRDEQEGAVMPSWAKLELLSAPAKRQFNTGEIIARYDRGMAMSMLADFILIGHDKVGTQALSVSKIELFCSAMNGFLNLICGVINRHAIPQLLRLNGMSTDNQPLVMHQDVQKVDLQLLGDYISKITSAGATIFPDPQVDKHLRAVAGLPEASAEGEGAINPDDRAAVEREMAREQSERDAAAAALHRTTGAAPAGPNPNADPEAPDDPGGGDDDEEADDVDPAEDEPVTKDERVDDAKLSGPWTHGTHVQRLIQNGFKQRTNYFVREAKSGKQRLIAMVSGDRLRIHGETKRAFAGDDPKSAKAGWKWDGKPSKYIRLEHDTESPDDSVGIEKFSPSQPRARDGRWARGGGGGVAASPGDALEKLESGDGVTVDPGDVRGVLAKAVQDGSNANLANLHVAGAQVFDGQGLGIARKDMPQITSALHGKFQKELEASGVSVTPERVSPLTLRPTQREISAGKTGAFQKQIDDGTFAHDKSVWVSKDNYVLDGHHRWAALAATKLEKVGTAINVRRINADAATSLRLMADFAVKNGIANKPIGKYYAVIEKFNASQPRDRRGRWSRTGGGMVGTATGGAGLDTAPWEPETVATAEDRERGAAERALRERFVDTRTVQERAQDIRRASDPDRFATSMDAHRDPLSGRFTPERQRLHDQIVEEMMVGIKPSADPTFHMMGGGPASGKSTLINTKSVSVPDAKVAVHIDSDSIKAKLPEYQYLRGKKDSRAAAFVHEESSMLSKRAAAEAVNRRLDVVFDGTGDSGIENLSGKVAEFRKSGHKVVANYATNKTSTALQWAKERAAKTGREVPETFIRETHRNVSRVLPAAIDRGLFDSFTLFDTNTKGKAIKVISGGRGKQTQIHNEGAWAAFKAKGQ